MRIFRTFPTFGRPTIPFFRAAVTTEVLKPLAPPMRCGPSMALPVWKRRETLRIGDDLVYDSVWALDGALIRDNLRSPEQTGKREALKSLVFPACIAPERTIAYT